MNNPTKNYIDSLINGEIFTKAFSLPQGRTTVTFPSKIWSKDSKLDECPHDWINVGFHFDKHVCKKCNKDKV